MHRGTELVCTFFSNFMPKAFTPKVIKNLYATPPSLFVPSAPQWFFIHLPPLHVSVCLLYKPFSLSLHISKEPLITLLPCLPLPCIMSSITLYHVFHYPVPCLLLLCLMPSITLLPCLLLPCLMSSITLLPCLLLPCLHQGMQNHKKRVDKLIIPRSHTPQNN